MPQINIGESKVVKINTTPPAMLPTLEEVRLRKQQELATKEKSLLAFEQLLNRRLEKESKSRKELKQEQARHQKEVEEFQKEKERFRQRKKRFKRARMSLQAEITKFEQRQKCAFCSVSQQNMSNEHSM